MRVILLGAPGSGKGSEAELMVKELGYTHISTGDYFRKNIKEGTPLGLKVKSIIEAGKLVPDEVTIEIVKNALKGINDNFALDGFPRTIKQADELSKFAKIDKVILIDVPYEVILKRLTGRRTCSNTSCKKIYNLSTYNKSNCEICGAPLYQRDDDTEKVIKDRYDTYLNQTLPLIDYYEKKKLLVKIKGASTPQETFVEVKKVLKSK